MLIALLLLTRDKDTGAAQPRRALLLLTCAARQCPALRLEGGKVTDHSNSYPSVQVIFVDTLLMLIIMQHDGSDGSG